MEVPFPGESSSLGKLGTPHPRADLQAARWAARDLTLITAGRFKSFCIMANKRGWRKNEPGTWKGDEKSGRFKQLVMRALSSDIITASKACGLLNWTPSELAENYQLIEA